MATVLQHLGMESLVTKQFYVDDRLFRERRTFFPLEHKIGVFTLLCMSVTYLL